MKKSKFMALILVVLMVATVFTGCGKNTQEEKGEESDGNIQLSDLKAQDFGGAEIVIATIWEDAFGNCEPGISEQKNAEIELRKAIEKKYNCKIVNKRINPNDTTAQIITKIKAGDIVGDIIFCQRGDMEKSRLVNGVLMDLNTVPNLDLKDSRWDAQFTKYSSSDGMVFGIRNGYIDVQSGLIVNLDLLEKLNLKTSIFDLVESHQWNYDNFIKICQAAKKDLNNDGKFDDKDQYGMGVGNEPAMMAMIMGNGVNVFERKADGTMEYTLNNQNTIDTINYLRNNLIMNKSLHIFEDTGAAFKNGQLLFYGVPVWNVKNLLEETEINLGFVPAPIGNNGKVKEYINLGDNWASCFCIAASNTHPERAGAVLSEFLELTDKSKENTLNEYRNEYFPNSPESMKCIEIMLNNVIYPDYIIEMNQTPWSAINASLFNPTDTIANKLQEIDSTMKLWVNETYNK